MEALMENKFYDRNSNVFYKGMNCENDEAVQTDDDTVIKQMKQDVKMKDAASLREHFAIFCENMVENVFFRRCMSSSFSLIC